MTAYLPPVGFHFRVEILDLDLKDNDIRFTDVGGLSLELATEEKAEGGQNRYVQKFPTRAKYPELTLKRGLLNDTAIFPWVKDCIENFNIQPMNVDVILLNDEHQPLRTWHLVNAYPTKWNVSDFSAKNNAIVVESMQLFYQHFSVE